LGIWGKRDANFRLNTKAKVLLFSGGGIPRIEFT
jgi:hypothetical protein